MDRWGYRGQTREDGRYRLPGVLGPGPADQPQPSAGGPDHRGLRRAARPPRHLRPPPGRAARAAARRSPTSATATRRSAPASTTPPASSAPTRPGPTGSQRWHDTSTLTPKVRALVRTQMAKAGRWLAAEHPEITEPGQWTRSTCAAWVAAIDRMTVGDYTQRRDHLSRPRRGPDRPAHQGPHPHGQPRVLPRLPGMGMDRPPLRPHPGAGPAAQRRRADRHRPADHRRRRLGQADLGRTATAGRGPARHLSRQLLPAPADPRARPDLAVLRPAQRRDLPAAGRLHPLAARRAAHRRRLHRRPCPRRRLPARRPGAQDRHRLHQARRPARRPGHRGLAGAAARAAHTARPQDRRAGATCCSPSARTRSRRTTSTAR